VRNTRTDEHKNDVWVYFTSNFSTTDSAEAVIWHDQFCVLNERCLVGNIDGAGGDDLIAFGSIERDGETVYTMRVSLAGMNRFGDAEATFEGDFCPANHICKLGDVDGNGRIDVIAFDRGADTNICATNVAVSYVQSVAASDCRSCGDTVPPTQVSSSISRAMERQAIISRPARDTTPRVFIPLTLVAQPLYCLAQL
jgi:hypothetical protein